MNEWWMNSFPSTLNEWIYIHESWRINYARKNEWMNDEWTHLTPGLRLNGCPSLYLDECLLYTWTNVLHSTWMNVLHSTWMNVLHSNCMNVLHSTWMNVLHSTWMNDLHSTWMNVMTPWVNLGVISMLWFSARNSYSVGSIFFYEFNLDYFVLSETSACTVSQIHIYIEYTSFLFIINKKLQISNNFKLELKLFQIKNCKNGW